MSVNMMKHHVEGSEKSTEIIDNEVSIINRYSTMKSTQYNITPPSENLIHAIIKAQNRHFLNIESMWCPC